MKKKLNAQTKSALYLKIKPLKDQIWRTNPHNRLVSKTFVCVNGGGVMGGDGTRTGAPTYICIFNDD